MAARIDTKIDVKLKLAALWASTMFCYIYNDYFALVRPGALRMLIAGKGPMGPVSQEFLLAATIAVSIPAVMVIAALLLRPAVNRALNIFFGLLFTVIVGAIALTPGAWYFYLYMSAVEIVLTLAIVWCAWTWPKQEGETRT